MDPYAAQTQTQSYPSSQIQQDPYIYSQQQPQYDPSQPQQQPPYDPSQLQHQQQHYDPSQIQQQYDPSQHYAYYTQQPYDPSQQYSHHVVYPDQQPPQVAQQPEQEQAPIHPPGVPVSQTDPNQVAAYQAYGQAHYQSDPNYYYQQQQQQPPQHVGYGSDPGMVHQQWQPQPGQPGDYGVPPFHPPAPGFVKVRVLLLGVGYAIFLLDSVLVFRS
ncbi:hypothetical protein HanHA300_Chr06g0200791 [Helianthus annuus]|nr:hypothetical protein HanHA300_Chr06g0200791 [Helianthus annuus]KAJ0739820.1 hypothetical protein HanOQP8_Chr06g0209911 [Helianthus annuus]